MTTLLTRPYKKVHADSNTGRESLSAPLLVLYQSSSLLFCMVCLQFSSCPYGLSFLGCRSIAFQKNNNNNNAGNARRQLCTCTYTHMQTNNCWSVQKNKRRRNKQESPRSEKTAGLIARAGQSQERWEGCRQNYELTTEDHSILSMFLKIIEHCHSGRETLMQLP